MRDSAADFDKLAPDIPAQAQSPRVNFSPVAAITQDFESAIYNFLDHRVFPSALEDKVLRHRCFREHCKWHPVAKNDLVYPFKSIPTNFLSVGRRNLENGP